MPLLQFTPNGIYCEAGDFYIDPLRSVQRAVITHGHSDHARSGHASYFAHRDSEPVLKTRLGKNIRLRTEEYGVPVTINGVTISLHPAGHIIGSAQVRVEYQGEVWVASGDYKLENDRVCQPFETVTCNTFITEATFALPIYRWPDQDQVFAEINRWWKQNQAEGKTSVLNAYSLGKAQRILHHLDYSTGPVFCHPSVETMNQSLREFGIPVPKVNLLVDSVKPEELRRGLVITPVSGKGSPFMTQFEPYSVAFASGWMAVSKRRNWQAFDRGFILSDHADWPALNKAITESGADKIIVTHGTEGIFSRWLREQGFDAEDAGE
ncbi:MAG: ligase-associated DNA damage response exonuclease [Bacteroidetes bacterium]|nr:ligase-associated DNA damage response exonuclease [Bacteroidota bacterium]